jgi:diaminopimelate decarboxylase
VAIRVNPDFELKSSGMKMGGGAQQFGIDAEKVPLAIKKIDEYDLHFMGLHIFTGSQNLNAEAIIQSHHRLFDLGLQLLKNTSQAIQLFNIGGGLGIPYFPGEKSLNLHPIGAHLEKKIEHFQEQHPESSIAMELGRYLVGNAGLYVAKVIDVKYSRGVKFAIIDGGLHHHLAASGNFGQVIRKNYPVAIGNRLYSKQLEPIQVVGSLCTPLDLMAHKYPLPPIEKNDLIVIYQSGAYGFTASPQQFLSHPPPIELLI